MTPGPTSRSGSWTAMLRKRHAAAISDIHQLDQWIAGFLCKRGKSPGGFGARPYRSAVGYQKMAEFHAPRSDCERMLHLRARTFAPLTIFVGQNQRKRRCLLHEA